MYILFVDESGSCEKDVDKSLVFSLVGTAIKADDYKAFSNLLLNMKISFFKTVMATPEAGEKKQIKRIRERKELKDILQPGKINRHNLRFMHGLLDKCIKKHNISVHPVIFLKDKLNNPPKGSWIYPLAFKRLISSFNNFLEEKKEQGLVILDSRDYERDDKLISSFYNYTDKNPFGIKCNNVLGPPLFARSFMTPGLEIAHHLAYITYCQYNDCCYRKVSKLDYSGVVSLWKMLSNNNAIYGLPNDLKGIIVWE